ncbi:hypothetical protein GCM10010912_58650 [Paenibacillus albidus]|uniref:Uncharacterized protein n=1 Tax=Paenibacillus albidus TaxID=2041023 RepID=A0A917D3W0_9BACL|nr:hypothetical protein GCM10010912_58650 [Paenibacillus albidus]
MVCSVGPASMDKISGGSSILSPASCTVLKMSSEACSDDKVDEEYGRGFGGNRA